jgi:hypothetical protein
LTTRPEQLQPASKSDLHDWTPESTTAIAGGFRFPLQTSETPAAVTQLWLLEKPLL